MIYIRKLLIENVRCFGKNQTLDFSTGNNKISQWTVILGDNGSGKTTLLRSITAMLPAPESFLRRRSNWDTEYDLSIYTRWNKSWSLRRGDGKEKSVLKLNIVETKSAFDDGKNGVPMDLRYEHSYDDDEVFNPHYRSSINTVFFSPVFCFAYGANRRVAPNSLTGTKLLEANETLFNDEAFLPSSEEFFLQVDYESAKSRRGSSEINVVKNLLKRILPSGIQDIKVIKAGPLLREVQVKTHFGWVNINELSLGYKTTIGWLIDFASKMIYYHRNSKNPFNEPAILILDEIDLHMHPAWQVEIVENLTKLFPKTQFIVTAHSPLIVQAALGANIILLKRVSNRVKIINDPDIIRTWRVDQVLTSDLFGLISSRSPFVEKLLEERNELLRKMQLDEQEKTKLRQIEDVLGELPVYDDVYEKQAYSALNKITSLLKRKATHD